jgi:peptide/nickel transport system permease protein
MTVPPRLRMVGWRLAQMAPVVVLATLVVFGLMQLVPGDPAVMLAGENPSPQRIQQIRQELGLDQPFFTRYLSWIGHAAQGDLSRSLMTSEPVAQALMRTFPHTLLVVAAALLISVAIGVPLGVAAAVRAGTKSDTLISGISSLGIAVPNFWFAMLLVALLSLQLQLFPATGATRLTTDPARAIYQSILPALAMAAGGISEIARQVRSALTEVLGSQYVRTLRAKGLTRVRILYVHGMKSIGVIVLTIAGLLVNRLLGATVVIEAVFAIPGTGSLVVNAALGKDFPVIQGVVLAMVLFVLAINLLVDVLYTFIDPRTLRQ